MLVWNYINLNKYSNYLLLINIQTLYINDLDIIEKIYYEGKQSFLDMGNVQF